MEQIANDHHLVLDVIDRKLRDLPLNIPHERKIFRVHHALRNINEKAYEPQLIAIGPYHHANDKKKAHLRPMEEHKLLYLKELLQRRKETSAKRYIEAMQQSEEMARQYYAEPISLGTNEFVEMMLLDGCFVIEFLRKNKKNLYLRIDNDPIFQWNHILLGIKRDLQLFENQLPPFILVKLFDMTKEGSENIINMAKKCFENRVQPGQYDTFGIEKFEELPHLLSLVHNCCCFPFKTSLSQRNVKNVGPEEKNEMFIKSATKLKEAGVKFKKAHEERCLFDIRFQNGTMEIPTLQFDDYTESLFRNYIAYEQQVQYDYPKYFTNYMHFIDCLISSPKDVEILHNLGIVDNLLGADEVVSSLVNKLGHNVPIDWHSFDECYSKVFSDVNEHCRQPINKSLAKLRSDYFHSPWAIISVVAAFVLFLLTIIQTVISILSVV